MKALSLVRPWSQLVLHAGKDIENRTWSTKHRGPLLVHGSNQRTSVVAGVVTDVRGKRRKCQLKVGIGGPHVLQAIHLQDDVRRHDGWRRSTAEPTLRLRAPVPGAEGAVAADIV